MENRQETFNWSEADRANSLNIEHLQGGLARYCLALTCSLTDAEDLIQDTWDKALHSEVLWKHNNVEAWLFTIARNSWRDRLRRRKLEYKVNLQHVNEQQSSQAKAEAEGSTSIQSILHVLMKHLTKQQRAVFLLRDVFHYRAKEVAFMLQMTEGAVKATLLRARAALQDVRSELRELTWVEPEDEGLKMQLHQMAAAYQRGDLMQLVTLVQQDTIDAASALAAAKSTIYRNGMLIKRRQGSMDHSSSLNTWMLAA